jgi:hypothetical protein
MAEQVEARVFKNRLAAHKWLLGHNYRVSQTKFYQDCRAGKVAVSEDGTYTQAAVEAYTKQAVITKRGESSAPVDLVDAEHKKAKIKLAKIQAARQQHKLNVERGLYVPREQHENDLAARIRALREGLLRFCRANVLEIIEIVGGDRDRAPDLLERFESMVDDLMSTYAQEGEIRLGAPGQERSEDG